MYGVASILAGLKRQTETKDVIGNPRYLLDLKPEAFAEIVRVLEAHESMVAQLARANAINGRASRHFHDQMSAKEERIQDLLEANNDYLQRARDAESLEKLLAAEVAALKASHLTFKANPPGYVGNTIIAGNFTGAAACFMGDMPAAGYREGVVSSDGKITWRDAKPPGVAPPPEKSLPIAQYQYQAVTYRIGPFDEFLHGSAIAQALDPGHGHRPLSVEINITSASKAGDISAMLCRLDDSGYPDLREVICECSVNPVEGLQQITFPAARISDRRAIVIVSPGNHHFAYEPITRDDGRMFYLTDGRWIRDRCKNLVARIA